MPARMTREEEDRIIEAYESWDPRAENVDTLADRLGVSKGAIYQVLSRREVDLKSLQDSNRDMRRLLRATAHSGQEDIQALLRIVEGYLDGQITEEWFRAEVDRYKSRWLPPEP